MSDLAASYRIQIQLYGNFTLSRREAIAELFYALSDPSAQSDQQGDQTTSQDDDVPELVESDGTPAS
jgi:hypothetical protein